MSWENDCMASLADLAKESSMRHWALTGPRALVKVFPLNAAYGPNPPAVMSGYFTQAKFLNGMRALEIERALGLQPQSLLSGATVVYAARLPTFDEVDYRYSAAMPDGRMWTAELHGQFDSARKSYTGMRGDTIQAYPPGDVRALQWQLKPGRTVPLSTQRENATVTVPFRA